MAQITINVQMSKEEIESIVKDFLAIQPVIFSKKWENKLVERLLLLNNKGVKQQVRTVHDSMLIEILDGCKYWLRRKYNKYSLDDINDIGQSAFIKWQISFDGNKSEVSENPEFDAMLQCTIWAQSDKFHADNPIIQIEEEIDETGNPVLNKKGEILKEKTKAQNKIYRETGYDIHDEGDEEVISSDFILPDKEYTLIESDGDDDSVQIGNKRFALIAGKEILNIYHLLGRIRPIIKHKRILENNKGGRVEIEVPITLPKIKPEYKPINKSIFDLTKKEFRYLKKSTIYYKNRVHYLKNAGNRKWMELAITLMRISKEKLDKDRLNQKVQRAECDADKYKQEIPILSAVAIDKYGNKIATCFKGEVDETRDGRNTAFDKHCEYSLFVDMIKVENMPVLTGGTLYVTLEPCNKRGYYLDGEEKKPKIPCAVRCVEAGIKTIYIGSLDDNKQVFKKGEAILSTGSYTFDLSNGAHTGTEKEKEASEILESYFRDFKKYSFEKFNNKIVYTIGKPITVHYFDSDLIEVVRTINADFLQRHNPEDFRK